jgi:hypothetical protein
VHDLSASGFGEFIRKFIFPVSPTDVMVKAP